MANRKNNFLSKCLIDVAIFIFTLFKLIPNLISLVELEAHAAKKSLISLLILYLIAGSLLTSTWLCILAMSFIYLISLNLSWLLSIFIIVAINVMLFILVAIMIMKSKKNLSFSRTRQLLRHSCKR